MNIPIFVNVLQILLLTKLVIMDSKTASWVSYITIIGWLIAFFSTKDTPNRDEFSKFHLGQSFGLAISGIAVQILAVILAMIVPALALVGTILGLGIFVLWIIGLINAINGKKQPVPLLGNLFVDKFSFI
jgi:uncharacterized membrane protein